MFKEQQREEEILRKKLDGKNKMEDTKRETKQMEKKKKMEVVNYCIRGERFQFLFSVYQVKTGEDDFKNEKKNISIQSGFLTH